MSVKHEAVDYGVLLSSKRRIGYMNDKTFALNSIYSCM